MLLTLSSWSVTVREGTVVSGIPAGGASRLDDWVSIGSICVSPVWGASLVAAALSFGNSVAFGCSVNTTFCSSSCCCVFLALCKPAFD